MLLRLVLGKIMRRGTHFLYEIYEGIIFLHAIQVIITVRDVHGLILIRIVQYKLWDGNTQG